MAYLPGLGRELLKAAANAPFLEREEEKQLALAWRDQGDRHAPARFFMASPSSQ